MSITIEPIADHPELIPVVAHWHLREWGDISQPNPLEFWTHHVQRSTFSDQQATLYVAIDQQMAVGSVSFVTHDMGTYTELSPWLAGLYVIPTHRRRGIGSRLIQKVIETTANLGIPKLYLYTHRANDLYSRLGWTALGQEYSEGKLVTMMVLDLHAWGIGAPVDKF